MKSINIGDKAAFSKTFSESDVYNFAGISGDFNPLHTNKVFAESSIFKERIVHGTLTSSLISTVLGMYLPGPGTIYLEQNTRFEKPVKIGDTITAEVEVVEFIGNRKVKLSTKCFNQLKEIVIEGYALVKI